MNNFNSNFNLNFNFINPNNPTNPNIANGQNNSLANGVNNIPLMPNILKKEPVLPAPMFQNNQEAPKEAMVEKPMVINPEIAKMDNEMLLKYLQSAMNMPESIDKFVKSLDKNALKILVKEMIDTKALGEFLNKNSTVAMEKILKTISETIKSGIHDVSQLKDILGVLSAIQTQTNLNTNVVKELLLLYIPLNPMVFDKQIDFSPASGEIEEKINNSTLSIIFETINFSNILCCINSLSTGLYVELYIDKDFPAERFSKVLNTVAKEINLRIELETKYSRKINSKEPKKARNFKIFSSGFVPTDVLLLAAIVIKTIFKTDEMVIEASNEDNKNDKAD